MSKYSTVIALVTVSIYLTGCSAGYNVKGSLYTASVQSGLPNDAVVSLEKSNSRKKDLLYYFEKGELLRLAGDYVGSRDAWISGDKIVMEWEDRVRINSAVLFGKIGSFILNDTTRVYTGRDYEKIFLNVRLALSHLSMNDFDSARIEIKKMHEREAIIEEFRALELEDAKLKAEKKGVTATSFKELDGYPVESLTDPSVRRLKNSYESAFANYLAGFIYEALGETSLAAPGYRKAIEMQPDVPALESALNELDSRVEDSNLGMVDTLFVIETGFAPTIKSQSFSMLLPVPSTNGMNAVSLAISWPIISSSSSLPHELNLNVDGVMLQEVLLTDTDLMARRSLSDNMPSIIARSTARAIVKAIAQKEIDDRAQSMGTFGLFASIVAKIASVATEKADERTWRTLPRRFLIARKLLPEGERRLSFNDSFGKVKTELFQLSGTHAVIGIRLVDGASYVIKPWKGLDAPMDSGAVSLSYVR